MIPVEPAVLAVLVVLAVVRGFVAVGAVMALAALLLFGLAAVVVGLATGRRRVWLAGSTASGSAVVLLGVAAVIIARAGWDLAGRGADQAAEEIDEALVGGFDPDGCRQPSPFNGTTEQFEQFTCLRLGDDPTVVWQEDDYLLGSGSAELVLDVNPARIEEWLRGPGPWEGGWRNGPVDTGQAEGYGLGGDGTGWPAAATDADVMWAAMDYRTEAFEEAGSTFYATGSRLLVVDAAQARVWFARTDVEPLR